MVRSRFARRRMGILLAVLFPASILLYGLGSAAAQFPRPPGMPNQPFGPQMPGGPLGPKMPGGPLGPQMPGGPLGPQMPGGPLGPKMPGGPLGPQMPGGPLGNKGFGPKIVYDWRCSKCGAIVATTNTPFNPGMNSCPRCGVNFINGGKFGLTPPPNMPPPGNMPPGNMPPGMPQPGMPQPGMPPANVPPNNPPPEMPPVNAPPPANAPANPVVAPPADPVDLAQPAAPGATCQWCNGQVSPGNRYCWGCKLLAGGITIGGALVVLVAAAICGVLVFVVMRSGGR